MAIVGEISKGYELGIGGTHCYNKFIYHACEGCGREKWVVLHSGKPLYKRCHRCSQQASADKRRGPKGKIFRGKGYLGIKLLPSDPFYLMASASGYVMEHRLIMARSLGRCLLRTEHVHHKDGIRSHNELSNLELVSPVNHALYNSMCSNCELRKEIRLLRWQLRELTQQLQEKLQLQCVGGKA
jgi:hypothetical protein